MKHNKTVLITGSSQGIGKAIALNLAEAGYHIVAHANKNIQNIETICQHIINQGGQARHLVFDVNDRENVKKILTHDIDQHGAYYGVVLNAGITKDNAFPALSENDWDQVIHTNLDAFYNVLHPIIMPIIRRRSDGRIVCITSVSGITGNRGQTNYSASKAGLIGAAKSLAIELAKRKITVNCVAPGLIKTDIINDQVLIADILKLIPANRIGQPEEVAHAVRFLLSNEASYITRQVLSVNGGLC